MAINVAGTPVDIYAAERRLDTWLWLGFRRGNNLIPAETFDARNVREILKGYSSEAELDRLINDVSTQRLLPLEYFKWIENDERQIKWLCSYVEKNLGEKISNPPARLMGRDYVIACFDFQATSLEIKAGLVNAMRLLWREHLKTDKMFKWFDDEDERSKCECAWEWLVEKAGSSTFGREKINNYKSLLVFFDECGWSNSDKKLTTVSIRNRWYQRSYRKEKEGEGSQLNVRLSNKAIAELDKLAKKYGVKRPQIIEALIRSEAKDGKYLPERMVKISFE